jgi:hypothetical protein
VSAPFDLVSDALLAVADECEVEGELLVVHGRFS